MSGRDPRFAPGWWILGLLPAAVVAWLLIGLVAHILITAFGA